MLIQNDQGGSNMASNAIFFKKKYSHFYYVVAYVLRVVILIWTYRRFKCNLKHLEGSYELTFFPFFSCTAVFYQSSYHCKVILNNFDDFNNILAGKGPEFKWQKSIYCLLQETY